MQTVKKSELVAGLSDPSDQAYLSTIEEILEEARQGRMFVLIDDEDRENEGDLVIPAQCATPEAINFMARFGRGLICLAMTGERIEQLRLPLMSKQNASRHQTAFTVSIEAREGVTTASPPLIVPAPSRSRSIRRWAPTTSRPPATSSRW
jgi:3,4-dihydroxy 2-butanone 4-phosphate synthase/GTP cyclohydrolase II